MENSKGQADLIEVLESINDNLYEINKTLKGIYDTLESMRLEKGK